MLKEQSKSNNFIVKIVLTHFRNLFFQHILTLRLILGRIIVYA